MSSSSRPGPLSAITLAVREGRLRAVDVIECSIAALESTRDHLNPFLEEDFEGARTAAEALDRGDDRNGPLAGAPLLIKDLEDWRGHPTGKGSRTTSREAARATGATPSKLIAAGAIPLAKATLPEFAIEGFTANLATGVTRNPWNSDYSPGGSSGGSAAALAAGAVAIATATDGGGSIRIPASFCGLVGLKPTNGIVGQWPAADWIDYSTDGPFATSADDLRLLYSLMRGAVDGDPRVPSEAMLDAMTTRRATRLIAAERTSPLGPLPEALRVAFTDAVGTFAQLYELEVEWMQPVAFFPTGDPDLDWFTVTAAEHVAALGRAFVENNMDAFHRATQEYLTAGLAVPIDDYLAARRRRFEYVRRMDEILGQDALLLTPTVASAGWLADGRMDLHSEVHGLAPAVFSTAMQNVTGNPALSLPAGMLPTGLPFGLQVTAAHFADQQLLDVADDWQDAQPWARCAPGYTPLDEQLGL